MAAGQNNAVKRLSGWKAIGQFLGCTERTARRWESDRAMPVHRVPGGSRGSVWASPDELTRWLQSLPVAVQADIRTEAQADVEQVQAAVEQAQAVPKATEPTATEQQPPAPPTPAAAHTARAPQTRGRLWALGIGALIALAGVSAWLVHRASQRAAHSSDPATTPYDDDALAREEYRNARFELATRSSESIAAATAGFRHLTERHPERAAGWSGLAESYLLAREFGSTSDADAYAAAARAARKAIGLDPKLADAWLDVGFVNFWWDGDVEAGLKSFETGLQLNPDSARGWLWYGNALASTRRFDEALRALARARSLDPESRAIVADESWAQFLSGHRAAGLATLERLAAIDPKFVSWHTYLQRCYLVMGRDEDFLREAVTAAQLRHRGDAEARLQIVAERYHAAGHEAMLEQLTADAIDGWQSGHGSSVLVAAYRAQARDRAGMLKWLAIAAAQHDHTLIEVPAAPEFSDYWSDPAVQQLTAYDK
jgi:cytochrome c-type biogenesis protein CcmH/NrfG